MSAGTKAGDAALPRPGLFELIASDYAIAGLWGSDGTRMAVLLAPLRFALTSSLRAALLFRLTALAPPGTYWFFRSLLIWLHSCEVMRGATIGRGIRLPHPFGIVIANDVVIGNDVSISQHVTIGSDMKYSGQPTIGEGVTLLPGAVVAGSVTIGARALIGANSVVLEDVEPGGMTVAGATRIRGPRDSTVALKEDRSRRVD